MALDPNISLGVRPPEAVDFSKFAQLRNLGTQNALMEQQIEASKASQASTEAQTPGLREQSAQQAIKTKQDQGRVQAAQDAVELDPVTKQPVWDPVTGTLKVNPAKFQYGLYRAGLGTEALKAEADQIKNLQEQQKATGGAVDLNNAIRNQMAVAAKAAYDQTQGDDKAKTAAAKVVWDALGLHAINASKKPGQTPLDAEQLKYTPGMEHTLYTAQITPGAQESLKVAQGQLSLGWAGNTLATNQFENGKKLSFTDPDSENGASPASQRARDIVFNTTGEKLPDGMSAGEIYRNPKYKGALDATGSNSAAQRVNALKTLNLHDSFSKTLSDAKDDLSAQGLTPANFVQNWLNNKVTPTPKLQALYAQMQQMPTGVTMGQTWEAMKATNDALRAQAKGQVDLSGGAEGAAKALAPGPTITPKGTPTAPVSTDTVRLPDKTGKMVTVHKENIEAFKKANGQK